MYMLAKYSLPKIERPLNNKVNYLIPVTDRSVLKINFLLIITRKRVIRK